MVALKKRRAGDASSHICRSATRLAKTCALAIFQLLSSLFQLIMIPLFVGSRAVLTSVWAFAGKTYAYVYIFDTASNNFLNLLCNFSEAHSQANPKMFSSLVEMRATRVGDNWTRWLPRMPCYDTNVLPSVRS